MRIADTTQFDAIRQSITAAQARGFQAANQASSGLRVGAPSDDPVAAAQGVRIQMALDKTATYRASIRAVSGDAELAESTLADATDTMNRAHEIALQGASGQLSASDRAALALEVGQLKEHMLSLANQKGSQGYLFGGTKTQTAPFSSAGAFSGDDLDRNVEIGPGVFTTVSTSGAKAFTAAGGRDILTDLDALKTALSTNDQTGVQSSIDAIDTGSRQISAARIDAGLKVAKLDAADTAHEQAQVTLAANQQAVVGIDPAQAYSKLAQAQQSLEQAVNVSKNMLDTLRMTPL